MLNFLSKIDGGKIKNLVSSQIFLFCAIIILESIIVVFLMYYTDLQNKLQSFLIIVAIFAVITGILMFLNRKYQSNINSASFKGGNEYTNYLPPSKEIFQMNNNNREEFIPAFHELF